MKTTAGSITTTLSNSSDGKSHGDGGEHALVDSEEEIRNLGGANRRSRKDIAESDIVQVADELAGGVREGE